MSSTARLILEDGTEFTGRSFGHHTETAGEVVFNTGMVGYPESLTDPSYRGQILVLTYPLTGNYGVPEFLRDDYGLPIGFESDRIQAAALIVSEYSERYSHHTARRSLEQWLDQEGIPAISGIDTRALTKRLREKGSMLGRIDVGNGGGSFFDPNTTDLASAVSVREVIDYRLRNGNGDAPETHAPKVILLDCGCKANIARSLIKRGIHPIRVPHDYYFLNMDFDGLVISNGPGDPRMYTTTTRNVERALAIGKPIMGICLGNQILARAVGAETYKLKFGHRSHNQPCVEQVRVNGNGVTRPGRCFITSQNHGYAVRRDGLPDDWQVWFTNANDDTIEGIRHVSKPFFSVQFHPEATPGPVDTAWLFDEFADLVRSWK